MAISIQNDPLDESQNTILKPRELQVNKEYELLITSPMGLVRYRIGDLVKCIGFYHKLPTIEFLRKTKHELSLGWVTISENEVIDVFMQQGINDFDLVKVRLQETGQGLEISIHEKYANAVRDFDTRLGELNPTFRREIDKGRIYPTIISIKNDIPTIKKHAQTKDNVFEFDIPA